jgi:hypothetical protein
MTEPEWLDSTDGGSKLEFLHGQPSERKRRLFAVACCRRIGHLLTQDAQRAVVEAHER